MSEAFPSSKWCSCPNRGQLGFFEKSVAYVQRNGVTFKHKRQLSFFERSTTSLKDTLHILKQYCFSCSTRLQLWFKYSIFEENCICWRECYHDKERKQECRTLKHNTLCRGLFFSNKKIPTFIRRFLPEKKTMLAQRQPPAYKWQPLFWVEGDAAAYLQWRLHFYKSHFFKALFATKRKPDPEKAKDTLMCKMDYFMTMVDIGFKI